MKILFDCYDTCCQNASGGVQIRMKKIFNLLKEKNIDVKYFNKYTDKIDDFDIIHLFKLEYQKYPIIECAKKKGKKIVISTIMSTKTGWKKHIQKLISKLPFLSIYKINAKMLNLADALICETSEEKKYIEKNYNINHNKIHVIANGVDRVDYNGKEIFERIGGQKKYVLQVGRFDSNKNQLNVIKALKNTNINLVFIGGADFANQDYYNLCLKEAEGYDNIYFLGWIDKNDNLLKSAFKNADTMILPSFYETFGLVILEGAMYGAKLALSNTLSILTFDAFKTCKTFSPQDIKDIQNVIIKTYNEKKKPTLKNRIINDFSWEKIIKEHIKIYEELLNETKDK